MEQVQSYFNAERYESLLFVVIGFVAIILSLWMLLFHATSFTKGISIPLIGIATIGIIVGSTVWLRSPKDIVRVESMLRSKNVDALRNQEIPRMETVMKNFILYRWIEIAFICIGLSLMFFVRDVPFWNGFGIGLFIQSALMLSFDFFAERRGIEYLNWLQTVLPQ